MTTSEAFQTLFFVSDSPIGRGLPEKIGQDGKAITGPWRDTRKTDAGAETSNRPITSEMIVLHFSGNLLQNGFRAMLMPYIVDVLGMAVATSIDLDVVGEGHANLPQHFKTVDDAMAAIRALCIVAASLGLRVWIETTRGGGKRLWIFHHPLPAADARDLGRLLLKRADLHPGIEVFPKQTIASADGTGNGVFLPYWGCAAPNRQVITDPLTGEEMTADTFAEAALALRSDPGDIAAIVQAARDSGEIAATRNPVPRQERTEGVPGERGDVSLAMWRVQTTKCAYLRGLVEQADNGQQIGYDDWLRLAGHLRNFGAAGRKEFHRLSEFDGRYDTVETDHKFDSLTGGSPRCDTTPCGKNPYVDCGLPEDKVSSSHWAYKGMALRMIAQYPSEVAPAQQGPTFTLPTAKKEYTQTDLGNARRLVDQHGEDIRYDHSLKAWFIWDGRRFQEDAAGRIWQRAKKTARNIYHEAADCIDDAHRSELAKHAKASEGRARLESMILLAQTEPEIAVTNETWEKNPWLLNCQNGTLDLKTGILKPHHRGDYCTRLAPVDYDPEAKCPLWKQSLSRWQPMEDVRTFLQRAVGYSLTGETREEVLFFTYGQGKNGKSKFTETLQALLNEYGVKAAAETFMLKKSTRGAATPELVALIGRRFVSVSEVEGGQSFSEALLKDMTGGDTMTARPMYRNEINFRPLFKLWFYGNVRPRIDGTDDGIWRRMMLIPFKVTIPKEEQDKQLLPKLLSELPGILNWALEGCQQWQADGLNPPASVMSATDEYRQDMDTIGAFLEEKCERYEKHTVRAADIYESYTEWSKASGEKPVTQNAFGHSLTQRGLERFRTGSGFKWRGVGLLGPEDHEEAENQRKQVNLVNLMHSKTDKNLYVKTLLPSCQLLSTQGSQGSQHGDEDEELI